MTNDCKKERDYLRRRIDSENGNKIQHFILLRESKTLIHENLLVQQEKFDR